MNLPYSLRIKTLFILFSLILFASLILAPHRLFAQTQCPTIPANAASVSTAVEISANGNYKVWSRIMAPTASNNSYFLQVDVQCAVVVGDDASMPVNSWSWVDYKDGVTTNSIILNLSSGTHTVTLFEREAGVKVDHILFSSDLTCVPTGTGDNCAVQPTATPAPTLVPTATPTAVVPTPTQVIVTVPILPTATPTPAPSDTTAPTVAITSPADSSTVRRRSKVTITAEASDASGVARVEFHVNGSLISGCSDTTAPYSCAWNVPAKRGAIYNLTAKAFDSYNNQATSSVIRVTAN